MAKCKWYDIAFGGICQLHSEGDNIVECMWKEPYFKKCNDFEEDFLLDEEAEEFVEKLAKKVAEILIRDGYIEDRKE